MSVMEKRPRSLIMCMTPLQMVIAEKIIQLNPKEDFDLLVIALSDNDKYRHYYSRLKNICVSSLYYITEKGIKGFLNYIRKLNEIKLNKGYKNLYLASIDSRHFQYILSRNKKANIYTFDDGAANVIPNDPYYLNSKPKLLKRIIWRGLGIKYYMKDIKNLSLTHYTIYKGVPNIIEKTQLIKLYKDNELTYSATNKVVSIYLGQPLEEVSTIFTTDYIAQTLRKIKIDFYYPHPREKNIPKGDYKVVMSPLVFEDYIINFLKDNPEVRIHVYSFISSAILNIVNLERIEVNYLYDKVLYNNYKEFYDFVDAKFNIKYIKLS